LSTSAIITAAGLGSRFGEPKQFKLLLGKPLYFYAVETFLQSALIDEVILVVPESKKKFTSEQIRKISDYQRVKIVIGGNSRFDSVKNGVLSSRKNTRLVCIHDAARPFVTVKLIELSISACNNADGAILAINAIDTIKYSNGGFIERTINRDKIWIAQTPQTFFKARLLDAYKTIDLDGVHYTDESSIMEKMGFKIALIKSEQNNFKITTIEDWNKAESLM